MFVLDPGQDRADLVRQARSVGYEHLAGELAGGMPAWEAAGLPAGRISLVPTAEVTGTVLGVRQARRAVGCAETPRSCRSGLAGG